MDYYVEIVIATMVKMSVNSLLVIIAEAQLMEPSIGCQLKALQFVCIVMKTLQVFVQFVIIDILMIIYILMKSLINIFVIIV